MFIYTYFLFYIYIIANLKILWFWISFRQNINIMLKYYNQPFIVNLP